MKITDLQTFVVANPPPHFGGLYFIFVKLTTDSGVTGYGEVYSVPFHPRVVEQMIANVAERYVIGADPSQIERLWRILYSSGFTQRPDTSMLGILSGIEMACWDILGKEAGKPVYSLLGGRVHEKLRSYSYLYPSDGDKTNVYKDPELAAERAAEYVRLGFTAIKFDPVTPYSAFDPRQLSLEHLDLAERFCKLLNLFRAVRLFQALFKPIDHDAASLSFFTCVPVFIAAAILPPVRLAACFKGSAARWA